MLDVMGQSINQCLINERVELLLNVGRVRHELDHQNQNGVALDINLVGCSVGSTPTESAYARHAAGTIAVHRLKSEAETQSRVGVKRRGLIGGHERHGARRENANAIKRAIVANHFQKTRVVVRRGSEASAAREALTRTIHIGALAFRPFRSETDLAVTIALIHSGTPLAHGG